MKTSRIGLAAASSWHNIKEIGKATNGAVKMAKSPASPQQGGSTGQTQQQQGQQPGGSTPQAGQPIFRDWASI